MSIVIDLFVLLLATGFAVLGVVMRLRRTISVAVLAVPAAVVVFVLLTYGGNGDVVEWVLLGVGVVVFLSLLVLLRLQSGNCRRAFVVQSVLLRFPATVLFGVLPAVASLASSSDEPADWSPHGLQPFLLVLIANVAAQLLVSVLQKWRRREPAWLRTVSGRALSGLLGLGYAVLLLTGLVPASILGRITLPASDLFAAEEDQPVYPQELITPPEFRLALAQSRLASLFLNPASPDQSALLNATMPLYGVRVRDGTLRVVKYRRRDQHQEDEAGPLPILSVACCRIALGQADCLIARDSAGFEALQLRDTLWSPLARVAYANPYARPDGGRNAWCTGDVDNDGLDEILGGDSNRLVVFKWRDTAFTRRVYDFPYQIDNLVVGDINNDGRNEVVLSASDEKLVDGFERERICVARLVDAGLDVLWNDRGGLKLGDNRVTPADRMLTVADLENRHHDELLVCRPATGERPDPSSYFLVDWQGGQLRILRTFGIVNRRQMAPRRVARMVDAGKIGSYVQGPLAVGRLNDRTVCLASVSEADYESRVMLLTFDKDNMKLMGRMGSFSPEVPLDRARNGPPTDVSDPRTQFFLMDLDGRGTAVLRWGVWEPGQYRYTLDRLLPARAH
jgi:hypothetical protein